jgi:hypothetical protein
LNASLHFADGLEVLADRAAVAWAELALQPVNVFRE